mmetsp:Transcript_70671/g.111872  ORF Transcript_70671/g.111872 Transcript_70671/m.111872 type:complete len:225 (+) Transcript_70671:59-733(+)
MATRASMMQPIPAEIKVGVRCQVLGKFMGTIKFVGVTKFAAGPWVGVELDAEEGKNDGTVQGERYFQSKSGHGIFARPNSVRPEPSLTAFAMPGEMPDTPESVQAAPESPGESPGESTPSRMWTRRASIEPDLRQDICVEERVDLISLLSGCADEVQTLTEAVDRVALLLQAKPETRPASEKLSAEDEAWLNSFTDQFERKLEEKLTPMLERMMSQAKDGIPAA